jgi:hypothetical protein
VGQRNAASPFASVGGEIVGKVQTSRGDTAQLSCAYSRPVGLDAATAQEIQLTDARRSSWRLRYPHQIKLSGAVVVPGFARALSIGATARYYSGLPVWNKQVGLTAAAASSSSFGHHGPPWSHLHQPEFDRPVDLDLRSDRNDPGFRGATAGRLVPTNAIVQRPPGTFDHHRLDAFHVARDALCAGDAIARRLPRGYAALSDQLRCALLATYLGIAEASSRQGKIVSLASAVPAARPRRPLPPSRRSRSWRWRLPTRPGSSSTSVTVCAPCSRACPVPPQDPTLLHAGADRSGERVRARVRVRLALGVCVSRGAARVSRLPLPAGRCLPEGVPFDELHRDEHLMLEGAGVVHHDHVGV